MCRRVWFCRAFGERRKLVPDDGATAAKKRRQAVARCVYPVASGRGSGYSDSSRRVFTKNATEPRLYGEVCSLALIHRSAWNKNSANFAFWHSRKFATATADCDDVEPCARHIAHASLRLCSDIRLRSKIARRLPFCPMVRGDRASQKMPLLPS